MSAETQTSNGHDTGNIPAIKTAIVKETVKSPGVDLISTFGKGLIYQKMVAILKEIGYVGKDQQNTVQNFKFRGIDQFVNALHPLLAKNGVFVIPENVSYKTELKEVTRSSGKAGVDRYVEILMKYHFVAEDGSSVTLGPIPAEGFDSGDKATNKALSAALKYLLIQTFQVPTEDMAEGDSDSPEHGTPAKKDPTPSSTGTKRGGFTAPSRNSAPKEQKASGEADKKPETTSAAAPAATPAETSAKTEAPATAAPTQPAETAQQSAPETSATGSANTQAAPATPAAAPKNAKERARFNPPKKTQREE